MVGSSARSHGVDRFYNPPAVRRQLELQQKQQRELELQNHHSSSTLIKPAVAAAARPKTHSSVPLHPALENRVELETSSSKASISLSLTVPAIEPPPGNFDRFMESTTPIVPALYFPKMSVRGWRCHENVEPRHPFFSLGDLWESFTEWSAYGAGVPLVLNESDSVVQYYVPYLSAIQLFVDQSTPLLRLRRPGDESDEDPYLDTSSEGSSESEADKLLRAQPCFGSARILVQQVSLSDDAEVSSSTTLPVFEFLENDPPHAREPLADKISSLASKFSRLRTYRSCDLLPSSWMSVAWYPIYRIPTGPTLRDLDACFLTFHLLSTQTKGVCNEYAEVASPRIFRSKNGPNFPEKLSVPIFGLASYKFRSSTWTSSGLREQQLASSLLQSANSWLRLGKVDHPDFRRWLLNRCIAHLKWMNHVLKFFFLY
ncbi:hypothetical protein HPP92_010674 [Vanilla planifolia]|uniref:Uncharacterized protein n=1 Tax=Vanilla planifolia TaxID=51239 RepID=A0A835V3Q1_VANPL|nr:hypothetical protein HPP92_010674 [Vanilla planifolia]